MDHVHRGVLFLWALVTLLQAQQNSSPLSPGEKYTVDGTVVNSITGEPVKRTRLTLQPMGGRGPVMVSGAAPVNAMPGAMSVSADAAGRFVFANLEAGTYFLAADRTGFVHQTYGQIRSNRAPKPLTIRASIHDLVFKLIPQAVITGKVVDENGDPMVGAFVQTVRPMMMNGRLRMQPMGGGTANDLGEYRIFSLEPGRYFVSATSSMRNGMMSGMYSGPDPAPQPETSYAKIWYPGTTDLATGTAIEVAAGREMRIDFTLTPVHAVHVRGLVTNPPGQNRGVNLNLIKRGDIGGGMPHPPSFNIMKGTFDFAGITPGSYMLTAEVFDSSKRMHARQSVEVGNGDVEGLALTLLPGIEITGTVKVEGSDTPVPSNLNIALQPVEPTVMRGNYGARVKPDGTFLISEIIPDSYALHVFSNNLYVKSATMNNQKLPDGPFTLSGEGNAGTLDIVLSANASQIEGTVLNGEDPAAEAGVIAIGKAGPSRGDPRTVRTDPAGHFTLSGLAPGDYKVYAFTDVENVEWANPEAMQKFENSGESVTLQEKDHKTVQLKVISAENP